MSGGEHLNHENGLEAGLGEQGDGQEGTPSSFFHVT